MTRSCLRDFVRLAKMELLFDRAIEAARTHDNAAFREAMGAFKAISGNTK